MSKDTNEPVIGKRLDLDLIVMTRRPGEISYKRGKPSVQAGETTIYSLADAHSERKFRWEASESSTKLFPGDRVQLKGTVKEIEPDGRIVLTRCRKA